MDFATSLARVLQALTPPGYESAITALRMSDQLRKHAAASEVRRMLLCRKCSTSPADSILVRTRGAACSRARVTLRGLDRVLLNPCIVTYSRLLSCLLAAPHE